MQKLRDVGLHSKFAKQVRKARDIGVASGFGLAVATFVAVGSDLPRLALATGIGAVLGLATFFAAALMYGEVLFGARMRSYQELPSEGDIARAITSRLREIIASQPDSYEKTTALVEIQSLEQHVVEEAVQEPDVLTPTKKQPTEPYTLEELKERDEKTYEFERANPWPDGGSFRSISSNSCRVTTSEYANMPNRATPAQKQWLAKFRREFWFEGVQVDGQDYAIIEASPNPFAIEFPTRPLANTNQPADAMHLRKC